MSSTANSLPNVPKHVIGWRYDRKGLLPQTLTLKSISLPKLKSKEALVQVHAAALNPADWKAAALMPSAVYRCLGPKAITAGFDFAGEIVALGTDGESNQASAHLHPGSKVFAQIGPGAKFFRGDGSLATHAVVPAHSLALVPEWLSYQDAAGFSMAALTATMMAKKLQPNERVLILGASTSVGLFLSQICHHKKAVVVGTASTAKEDLVKGRGVTEFIDYTKVDVVEHLRSAYQSAPFEWIFDCVGQIDVYYASPSFLKPKGTFYSIGDSDVSIDSSLFRVACSKISTAFYTTILPSWLGGTPRKYVAAVNDGATVGEVDRLAHEGVLTPVVDSVFSFEEVPKAFSRLLTQKPTGKIIIKVSEDAE